jgi:hypothetical protein
MFIACGTRDSENGRGLRACTASHQVKLSPPYTSLSGSVCPFWRVQCLSMGNCPCPALQEIRDHQSAPSKQVRKHWENRRWTLANNASVEWCLGLRSDTFKLMYE